MYLHLLYSKSYIFCKENSLSPPEPSHNCDFLEVGTLMLVDYGNIFLGIFHDTLGRLENGFGKLSDE